MNFIDLCGVDYPSREKRFDVVVHLLSPRDNRRVRVKAQTEIDDFNRTFGTDFSDEDFDTVGGLVLAHLGRLPKRGEQFRIGELNIKVVRADSRRLHALLVEKVRTESAA